jgi:hypothetical protein
MYRFIALLPMLISLSACGAERPTEAVAVNGYALSSDGSVSNTITVYRVWYATTLFRDPLAPKSTSAPVRTVPGSATAYAVLAPGWDPSSSDAPSAFIPVQSNHELGATRGDTIDLVVSDRTFSGRCGGSRTLDQDEADFITQRIFPAEFEGMTYDPATCTSTAQQPAGDAGGRAAPDAGGPH